MGFENRVQLITYPDSLGGDLPTLARVLSRHFAGVFGGLHILPPYPSTGDRGFAPVSYLEIEPRFGDWADIGRLSATYDILLDFMVNHISRHSVYFQDFVKHGRSSKYADLFITLDKVWPGGAAVDADIQKIFLRRPKHPFVDVTIEADGSTQTVWATFGSTDWSEQIDIDVSSAVGREFIIDVLQFLAARGVNSLRLDAVAFVVKKAGTSCFLVEPQIDDFLAWIHAQASTAGINLLMEVHTHPDVQAQLARRGYWVYNFVLPLLVLHTILDRSSAAIKAHLAESPRRQMTMLDCHDGIPVLPDIEGVLDVPAAQRIVQLCSERGANISRIYSREHHASAGFDAHQINCTYYSALNGDDDAYILARAIQFFAPGIPQVYYVGLLAGENMPVEIELQGENRAVNRHNYSEDEVRQAVEKPVVQRLIRLIRFRNEYPAFRGEFAVKECSDRELVLEWVGRAHTCTLRADLASTTCTIETQDDQGRRSEIVP